MRAKEGQTLTLGGGVYSTSTSSSINIGQSGYIGNVIFSGIVANGNMLVNYGTATVKDAGSLDDEGNVLTRGVDYTSKFAFTNNYMIQPDDSSLVDVDEITGMNQPGYIWEKVTDGVNEWAGRHEIWTWIYVYAYPYDQTKTEGGNEDEDRDRL